MEQEIKKITVVSGSGVRDFEIGVDNVAVIKDSSIEYENAMHSFYVIMDKNGEIIHRIENCPAVIDYKN